MARVCSTPLFAASQATSAPNSPMRSARTSPRLGSPPPPASRPPRSSRPHAQPDYGEIFGISSGSFWSSADLAAWPSGSRASSVSSEDSTITNSSVAGWREAVVGNVLADQQVDAAAAMGFYAPEDDGGSTPRNRLSRSMSGSPDDRGGAGGWARIAALRPSSARGGTRPTRGASESPARPASPLVMFPHAPLGQAGQAAGAGASRPRLGSHDDARAAAVAQPPAGPAPPPLSLAPGATPRLSAELLRRVAAPAVCAGVPSLYADAAAERRRFWAEGGAAAAAAATRLGAQLEAFAAAVEAAALQARPARLEAVTRVTRALQDLWPRARTRVFGSEATGLALPSSDVDLVVALPPVRQALRPIMEAGILEGRNAIEESHVKQAARQLARQEWAAAESMLSVENTAVPIVSLAVRCAPPPAPAVRVDLSFDAPGHAGLTSAELVRELLARYPALAPLALALKQFLKERSLHHAYTGGLSSYCLLLLLAAYTKHAAALDGPLPLGRLFADVLAFYGRAFDPRRSAVALAAPAPPPGAAAAPPPDVAALFPPRGGREALIDVLHICDPLQLTQGQDVNVARNCFRMLQIQKALADASKLLDEQLLADEGPLLESLICTRI
jgi:predicted nucleotidyltransferase